MPRVTYVKAARQRYATVPVLGEGGAPLKTPVMRRDGSQKKTKNGKPVEMRVTVSDKSKPLPNHKCGKCGVEIKVGDSYKHISPKSGPYGGRTMYRCTACPNWQEWEYSSSLSARLAQISHEAWDAFNKIEFTSEDAKDEMTSLLEDTANQIREIAEEKKESAENIEEGFGHPTYLSEELTEQGDNLEQWADEIENADVPDFPEVEDDTCEECDGNGWVDNPDLDPEAQDVNGEDEQLPCDECNGSGTVEPEEPTEDQLTDWGSECESVFNIVDECPI